MSTRRTTLNSEYDSKTIQELVHLFNNGQLNLNPAFQRQSVWTERDRRKLMESIFQNYPIPSIFLYKQHEDGRLSYDVIDGKQRLESILMRALPATQRNQPRITLISRI